MSGLREAFDEIVADVPTYGDLDRAIEQAGQERRRRTAVVTSLAAAAAVLVVVAGTLVITKEDDGGTPQPAERETPTEPTGDAVRWSGPVRQGTWPVQPQEQPRRQSGTDPQDSTNGGVDIVATSSGGDRRDRWNLELRSAPPRASTLDPAQTVIEYGVVIDVEEDGVADCQISINNDAPQAGDYRVSVTSLTTGVTEEQVGPPYGIPIDFMHPDEEGGSRHMVFFSLPGSRTPCDPLYVPASYYAYASLTEGGRVTSWDYAPDAVWLEMP